VGLAAETAGRQSSVRLLSDITNPKPETRHPETKTRSPEPETRNPKPGIRNPSPKLEILTPKPETQNLKPEALTKVPTRETTASRHETTNPESYFSNTGIFTRTSSLSTPWYETMHLPEGPYLRLMYFVSLNSGLQINQEERRNNAST
jgi:hypothetical protein